MSNLTYLGYITILDSIFLSDEYQNTQFYYSFMDFVQYIKKTTMMVLFSIGWSFQFLETRQWSLIYTLTHVTINKIITSLDDEAESSHALSLFITSLFFAIFASWSSCTLIGERAVFADSVIVNGHKANFSVVLLLSYNKTDRTLFENWQESEWMNERIALHDEISVFLFRQA